MPSKSMPAVRPSASVRPSQGTASDVLGYVMNDGEPCQYGMLKKSGSGTARTSQRNQESGCASSKQITA